MTFLSLVRKIKIKEREMRLLILGLDSSGKSTILKSLLQEDVHDVSPTLGFQIKTNQFFNGRFQVHIWDIGGQSLLRPFWRNYYEITDGLIWVIDGTSSLERLSESSTMLHEVLSSQSLLGASILIFLNKTDLPDSHSSESIKEALNLLSIQGHRWYLQPCSAIRSENIQQGFDWIVQEVATRTFPGSFDHPSLPGSSFC